MKTIIVSLKREFSDQIGEIADKIQAAGFPVKKFTGCTVICQSEDLPSIASFLEDVSEVRSWMQDRPLELIQPVNRVPKGL